MRIPHWMILSMIALTAGVSCSAQQKFPLRSGEWAVTSSSAESEPTLFCLNDEMWEKALTRNPSCTIQELTVTSGGASYSMSCALRTLQMKGKVTLTFDGMEHMTGKALIDIIRNGQTTTSTSLVDYRWKSPACSPNDVNMRAKPAK
ncbi:DUF3617 domain-containing protein [Paracidobacterium acidisoli]|uniref:DUF3617 family protein n=1 Tax=Paracidobacterium acidisoli TaxID=2303751 RepID=A0A372IR78_9BACT|nr:DUF3617 family protein [Paracidobacterium acidisoli]MBT9330332.1 DUF3617 domain-containing protein [Paracidobacterium acidisoli]